MSCCHTPESTPSAGTDCGCCSSSSGGAHEPVSFREMRLPLTGLVFFAAALIAGKASAVGPILYAISYLLIGGQVLLSAIRNAGKGRLFDENFLMSVATLGALLLGEYAEAVSVMIFYRVGEYFQERAIRNSRKSIKSLLSLKADTVHLETADGTTDLSPEQITPGQIIQVRPGERVPLDGEITKGHSTLDVSALTGESLPRTVSPGKTILSGSLNQKGVLSLKVTRPYGDSTVARILKMVETAATKKTPVENFITRFSRYYTPAVVILALLIALLYPLLGNVSWSEGINRGLILLVISCPCALVLSIPLGYFAALGSAAKNGILFKGSNYLEALNRVKTVVFDKTGTLTKGTFSVTAISPAPDFTPEELLLYAAAAEYYSTHPIAESIKAAGTVPLKESELQDYTEQAGSGTSVKFRSHAVLAGTPQWLLNSGIEVAHSEDEGGTLVHIGIDGRYAGSLLLSDTLKEDSLSAIEQLKSLGIRKTVMLTGDHSSNAARIGRQLHLDEVFSGLLPEGKVEKMEELNTRKKSPADLIAFVGDGINDTPALARADIGIAMGHMGNDAAMESADVVLMGGEPSKLAVAMHLARRTARITWQNIFFILGVKILIMALGGLGLAGMWEAIFADVGVCLIAILNSLRTQIPRS